MFERLRAWAMAAVVASGAAWGAPLPAGVERVVAVEGVTEYRLKNGLRVLLYPDDAKPTVTVNMTYLVGSRHESYGETGMAHLLEHLIFKGSRRFPNPDVEFARRGFSFNGTTSLDRTNYFATFRASDDNLRWAIGWHADAMAHSFVSRKHLDTEMPVVRNEFELGEDRPYAVLSKRILASMFHAHAYGKPVIGNRSDIENVKIENLRAFYRRYYQPDNAVLVVAGRFDPARTLRWIADAFASVPRPTRVLPELYTVEPLQDGERSVLVRRKGEVQLVAVAYRLPSGLHRQSEALAVAAEVLAATPTGRLHAALVDGGPAAKVDAWHYTPVDPGAVIFFATLRKGEAAEAVRARMVEAIEQGFADRPPSAQEVARVLQAKATSLRRTLLSPEEFGVEVTDAIALGDWRLFFESRDRLAKVDAAAVAEVARAYFRRDNRTVAVFVPEDAPQRAAIPAAPRPAERLAGFVPRASDGAGEAFVPTQENIDARTRRLEIGDLKVALLPKKVRGGTVSVRLAFRWGDLRSLSGRRLADEAAWAMVERGTKRLTRLQLEDERIRLRMEGDLRGFQTDRENLAEALRLVAHMMREPAFPEAEFETYRRGALAVQRTRMAAPAVRAFDRLAAHFDGYPPEDPRHVLSIAERIAGLERLSLEDVRRHHADHWGTARGEIAIVGDFDADEIARVAGEVFGVWRSPAPFAHVLAESREVAAARHAVALPDTENAAFAARLNLDLDDEDPDLAALLLANRVFGGGGLSSRLMDRVRQREGLSYGAYSQLRVPNRGRASSWDFSGSVAPQNLERFERAAREEFARLVRDGITPKELADARDGLLQERLLTRSDDTQVAGNWLLNLDRGRSFAYSKALEERMARLTAAEVNAVLKRRLSPERLSAVVAGDPAKGGR